MRLNYFSAIVFSGVLWLGAGIALLLKGLNFIVHTAHGAFNTGWIIPSLSPLVGGKEQSALMLIALGLIIGFVKGRLVLVKTVKRVVRRILSMESPVAVYKMYSWKYLLLILSMMGLAMSLRWMPLGLDLRGLIDVAVGSALINGALIYFRYAVAAKSQKLTGN